eukprot:5374330-Prymnesium_polylepis.1
MDEDKLPLEWDSERFQIVPMLGERTAFYSRTHGRFVGVHQGGVQLSVAATARLYEDALFAVRIVGAAAP